MGKEYDRIILLMSCQCGLKIRAPTPNIVDASQIESRPSMINLNTAVVKNFQPGLGQSLHDHLSSLPVVMITEDAEDSMPRIHPSQDRSQLEDCIGTLLNEIAGKCNQVWFQIKRLFDSRLNQFDSGVGVQVKITEKSDSKTFQKWGSGNLYLFQSKPFRLHSSSIPVGCDSGKNCSREGHS